MATVFPEAGFTVHTTSLRAEPEEVSNPGRHALVVIEEVRSLATVVRLCRVFRERWDVAIMVSKASAYEAGTVAIFNTGADGCLTKPGPSRVLLAHADRPLRRASRSTGERVIEIGDVRLDRASPEVTLPGRPVPLTRLEFDVLRLLMVNAGRTVRWRALMEGIWRLAVRQRFSFGLRPAAAPG